MGIGAFWFGVVIGFVTYRTLKHKTGSGLSDIAAVIGAIGGGAVLKLFPAGSDGFDQYCVGLAVGFFGYLVLSLIISAAFTRIDGTSTKGAKAANEFLGN